MIKRYPLAFTSLIVGILSFVHLFGLEKALLAITLGGIALKSALPGEEKGKKFAYIGIVLGSLYVVTLIVVLIIKGPQIIATIGRLK
jgi:hypothetical protein